MGQSKIRQEEPSDHNIGTNIARKMSPNLAEMAKPKHYCLA